MSRKKFLHLRLSVGFQKADRQPKNLWEASIEIFHEILKGTWDFQRYKNEMLYIQNVEHEELVKYYDVSFVHQCFLSLSPHFFACYWITWF